MQIRQHAVAPLATALALVLGLTACGGDDETAPKSSASPSASSSATESPTESPSEATAPAERATVAPATGKKFTGKAFSFHAPKGWTNATETAKELNSLVELAAAAAPDATGFATNVNVVVADAGVEEPTEEQLQQITSAIEDRLKGLVPNLKVNEPTVVAGQPALDHEGAASKAGMKYYIHQFVAFHEGKAYTITFSFSRERKPAQRTEVIDAVLASWSWS